MVMFALGSVTRATATASAPSWRCLSLPTILQSLPMPDFRDATADFIDRWHSNAANVDCRSRAAPEPAKTRFRQTEQAILEVVNSATRRLTVVDEATKRREHVLHTVGNLTLVTDKLNPAMSNGSWPNKKAALAEHSSLAMNRKLIALKKEWCEAAIEARSKELFDLAKKIWPRPDVAQTGGGG